MIRRAGAAALGLAAGVALAGLVAVAVPARADTGFMPLHEPLERFPQSDLTIESGEGSRRRTHRVRIWLADTPERREQGLMFQRALPGDRGMLFTFDPPQPASFWMKNTFIPLDMLFVAADGRVVRIAENVTPMTLATVDSGAVVRAVLELAGGSAKRLGLRPGDRVRHPAFATR